MLKDALLVAGVRDKADILDRLRVYYEEMGEKDTAAEYAQQESLMRSPKSFSGPEGPSGNSFKAGGRVLKYVPAPGFERGVSLPRKTSIASIPKNVKAKTPSLWF